MRLKILTTGSLLLGVALLFAWPFLIGPRPPKTAPKLELAHYAEKYLIFFGITAIVFVMTAFFAWLLARQMRVQYLEQTKENLESLVEGTLQDHAAKRN